MSIFGDILTKIFPSNHPAVDQVQSAGPTSTGAPAVTLGAKAAQTTTSTTPAAATTSPVDVQKTLSDKAAQSGQHLNWQTSIVDLPKLLGLDSSLAARKQLADNAAATRTTPRA
jgi:hypothetical protein